MAKTPMTAPTEMPAIAPDERPSLLLEASVADELAAGAELTELMAASTGTTTEVALALAALEIEALEACGSQPQNCKIQSCTFTHKWTCS
jgi:hypothetical protein